MSASEEKAAGKEEKPAGKEEGKAAGNVFSAVLYVTAAVLLVLLDQYTKHLAALHLKNQSDIRIIPDVLHLTYLYPENRGIAFGLMQGGTAVFAVLSLILMAVILYVLFRIPGTSRYVPMKIICILLLSGAAGNLIDRVFRGYVIDFIYFCLIDFPVFNLADVFVVSGGALLIITGIFVYKEDSDYAFIFGKR